MCLCLLPVVSTEKSLGPSPLHPLIRDFYILIKSLQISCCNSLIIFVAPHRTHCVHALSSPALDQALQGWERGIITSLDVLPRLFLTQLMMLLDFIAARALCWLRIHFVSTQSFRSFSAELLPSSWFPACPCAWNYSSPSAGLFVCLVLFPLPAYFSNFSGSLLAAAQSTSWSINHSS